MKNYDTIKEIRKIKDDLYALYLKDPVAYQKEMKKASEAFRKKYIFSRVRKAA